MRGLVCCGFVAWNGMENYWLAAFVLDILGVVASNGTFPAGWVWYGDTRIASGPFCVRIWMSCILWNILGLWYGKTAWKVD